MMRSEKVVRISLRLSLFDFIQEKFLILWEKFTIQPLNLRLTRLFNSSFAHVQLDSTETNDAIRKRPRSDLSSLHPKVRKINNLLCLFIFFNCR